MKLSAIRSSAKFMYMRLWPEHFKQRSFRIIREFGWEDVGRKNIETEFLLLPFLITNKEVFFDVGANIGQYSDLVSKIVDQRNIHLFEPNPLLFRRLCYIFPNSRVNRLALSDSVGFSRFVIPLKNGQPIDTQGSISTHMMNVEHQIIEVETNTLDTYVLNHQIENLGCIKIDVEGFELHVIKGAAKTLQQQRPSMIVEIDKEFSEDGGAGVFRVITDLGYTIYYVNVAERMVKQLNDASELKILQSSDDWGVNKNYINNFICIHSSKELGNVVKLIEAKLNNH